MHQLPPLPPQDAADRAKKALAAATGSSSSSGSGSSIPSLAAGQQSDHLALVAAYGMWQAAVRAGGSKQGDSVAKQHWLSVQTLEALSELRGQFASMIAEVRFVQPSATSAGGDGASGGGRGGRGRGGTLSEPAWLDDPSAPWNRWASSPAVVKAVLAGSLAPNVAVLSEGSPPAGPAQWEDATGTPLYLHGSSVCSAIITPSVRHPFLVFLEKVATGSGGGGAGRVSLREVTPVGPTALLLMGTSLTVLHQEGAALVDGWIRVAVPAQTAVVVKGLRRALDGVLQAKVERPHAELSGIGGQVVEGMVRLLEEEETAARHQASYASSQQ